MTDAEIQSLLEEAAASPDSVQVDGQSVKSRSLKDLLEVADYLKRSRANSSSTFPVRLFKFKPGGPV